MESKGLLRRGPGGKRKGAGRKAADGATQTIAVAVSLTPEHHAKLKALGGSLWLRKIIDREFGKKSSVRVE